MSIIEHIILFSILFTVYAFWGKYNAHRTGVNVWIAAMVPIFLYVFVVGSRYGWGADYLWYKFQYENAFISVRAVEQIGFKWLNQSLSYIGFNYVGVFMVYAFIFIVGAFILLRSYGELSMYMYCLLVPATLFTSAHTIRQGVGFAFIFIALAFFQKRKWLFMALAALIAFNIHSSVIIIFATMIGIFFFFKKPIHYWFSIPVYIIFAFVFEVTNMDFLNDFLTNNISLGSGFQWYIDNTDVWMGEDAIREGFVQSTFALIISSAFYISLFYLGYIALKAKENKHVLFMYNTVVLGAIMMRAFFNYEILRRLIFPMRICYFIPLGYIFYVYFRDCKQPENQYAILLKKYFPVGITLILAYLFMFWGRWLFLNPNANFFWRVLYHLPFR